jgi:hypothetical protein
VRGERRRKGREGGGSSWSVGCTIGGGRGGTHWVVQYGVGRMGRPKGIVTFLIYSKNFQMSLIKMWTSRAPKISNNMWI